LSTNYTGVATATQAPGPQPALNAVPVVVLPADGDAANAASIAQAHKESADFLAWLAAREISGPWGAGLDGDLTVAGTSIIGGNKAYNNLTIGAAGLLIMQTGGVIRVKGTLNIASGGKITSGAADGNVATSGNGGIGGLGWNQAAQGALFGGANGGHGADGTVGNGTAGGAVSDSIGGSGGAGGTGTSGAQGAGGVATAADLTLMQPILTIALAGGWGFKRVGLGGGATATPFGITGGAGGGGGGSAAATSNTAGGGGGSGGNVLIVIARKVVIAADGALFAAGGAGGGGFSGMGGGGGGGGGVILVYGQKTGVTLTAAACCPGGAGGGGFAAGVAGSVGQVYEYNVGY
jgi:hypothetical protein